VEGTIGDQCAGELRRQPALHKSQVWKNVGHHLVCPEVPQRQAAEVGHDREQQESGIKAGKAIEE
jgi:hypothetical protein